jgi:exonuclease SbcD
MRILHLADFHLKLTGPRAEECRRILDWIPENAREVKPDAIIIAGDVYDRRSTPEERLYLASILSALADVAPVFAINGNHDDSEDLRLFHQWRPEIEIITEPTLRPLKGKTLAFLPWPSLGHLAAAIGPQASIAERREIAKAALIDVLRGFKSPTLLVAHISVTGASMDTGQPVSGGEEIALSADELLECGAAGVALGHIHLRQQMRTGCQPVWYAGAPFRNSFGEASGKKGGLIWNWNGQSWDVTPWDLPARDMTLLEASMIDGKLIDKEHDDLRDFFGRDAEVRLRIEFPSEEREAARAQAEEWKARCLEAHALSVTIEERPIVITRSRCAEIEKARTPADKLAAWAHTTDQEIPEGVAGKLTMLEAEARP